MKESVIERNKRLEVDKKIADFMVKQRQPYAFKRRYAEIRAWEFANECEKRGLGKRSGVDDVHPHRFRRTCATMALQKGMPLALVSRMLGHENIGTTQIYLDLDEEDLKLAHKRFVT